jgi:hypothetical protein
VLAALTPVPTKSEGKKYGTFIFSCLEMMNVPFFLPDQNSTTPKIMFKAKDVGNNVRTGQVALS